MTNEEKYKVISQLQQLRPPKDIAEDLGISYGRVLKLKREYEDAVLNNDLANFLEADKLLITTVSNEISKTIDIEEATTTLLQGVDGLEHLSAELHKTALYINSRVGALASTVTHLSELEVAAEIICKLQVAFLNKNLTQVNVQNNYGDTPRYSAMLGDAPGA